jgi:hypothetical protein
MLSLVYRSGAALCPATATATSPIGAGADSDKRRAEAVRCRSTLARSDPETRRETGGRHLQPINGASNIRTWSRVEQIQRATVRDLVSTKPAVPTGSIAQRTRGSFSRKPSVTWTLVRLFNLARGHRGI